METTTMLELEVKIMSRESVKPSTPTPPHLQNFHLSMIDQISAPLHVSSLIFYDPSSQTHPFDITALKLALSQTLTHFYPLAGRCKDDSTVICNDEGVPFIEAHVNSSLSDLISSPQKLDLLGEFQFLPPKDILSTGKQHISELVHLAFQINVFTCGGVVIGCYMLHKILDGASFGLFFRHWSALARKNCDGLIKPDFDSTVVAFPPYHPKQQEQEEPVNPDYKYYIPTDDSLKLVGKGFIFRDAALTKIKATAASKQVPNPTRFESLLGFIWEQCLAAEAAVSNHSELPVLLFAADIRKRVGPPLSENSVGNLVANPIAFANSGIGLPELVAEIHDAILKVKDETVTEFLEGGAEAVLAHRGKLGDYLAGYRKGTYLVSSWCRNGLSEADFGFGKPRWIVFPVTDGEIIPARRNFISLTDYNDTDGTTGTAAWIYLEEKEMQILDSNQEFLAYASLW